MACDATLGRGIFCKDDIAGWSAFYFIKTSELGTNVTFDATGLVSDFGACTAYKYKVLTASTLDDDSVTAEATGTTFNTFAGTITLVNQQTTDLIELESIQKGNYSIVGARRNGTAKLFGYDTSAIISSLKALHGDAEGDLVGWTMDIAGKSDKLSPFILGATKANPFAGITTPANVTVIS